MSTCSRYCGVFALFFGLSMVSGLAQTSVLELPAGPSHFYLGRSIAFLEDKQGQLTFEEISTPAFGPQFRPATEDALNFGVTSSTIWLRFSLRDQQPALRRRWLLSLDYPLLDSVTLYGQDTAGNWQLETTGDRYPFRQRAVRHRNLMFWLPLPDSAVHIFYLRFVTTGSLQIGLHVQTETALAAEDSRTEMGYGLFFGALFIMICYNLFLFFSLRDRAYLAYVLVTSSSLLVQAAFSGHLNQYVLGDSPAMANLIIPLLMATSVITMCAFAIIFLDTRRFASLVHWVLIALLAVGALDFILAFFLPIRVTTTVAGLCIALTSLTLIAAGVISLRNGNRSARYFLLAWVLLLAGVMVTSLRNFGLLAPNFFTINSMKIGGILEVVLLAMALSDKYNLYKKDKEVAQAQLLQLQQEANRELEAKVQERTHELAETNQQLNVTLDIAERERQHSDRLLRNILPEETAAELKLTGHATPKYYDLVSVLFTDFRNFTRTVEQMQPQQLIEDLNYCFLAFDGICERHNLEKIKTIGDSYMAAGGLPVASQNNPVDAVRAALEMQAWMETWKQERLAEGQHCWEARIGIHSGPVVAGVIGKNKFAYDIWGDTVNLASRMENAGEAGQVNISEATFAQVQQDFQCTYRGKIAVKNKGEVGMYWVC